MSADLLQKVFKTFSDPTRVRILGLLEREELAVQELMDVLGMAQSRVSRHLAILRDAGLVHDRRDGTYVFYRFVPPGAGAWQDAWALVSRSLASDPTSEREPGEDDHRRDEQRAHAPGPGQARPGEDPQPEAPDVGERQRGRRDGAERKRG